MQISPVSGVGSVNSGSKRESPPEFDVGDRVRIKPGVQAEQRNAEGVVRAILSSDKVPPGTRLYSIEFEFGTKTLYGTQLLSPSRS